MGRFEGVQCDGPNCITQEAIPEGKDCPNNWYMVYQYTETGMEEKVFCCVSCLARWSNRADSKLARPRVVMGDPKPKTETEQQA